MDQSLTQTKSFILLLLAFVIIIFDTACSRDFKAELTSVTKSQDDSITQYFTIDPSMRTKRRPTDVLFIVDESVSMKSVIDHVRQGFNSVDPNTFPSDTLLAVTNMAPAIVDSFWKPTFGRSFIVPADDYIVNQPGFLRLVTANSIANFKTKFAKHSDSFTQLGCQQGWFRPTDVDADGINCLNGASQVALQGIGVEAGVVSLKELTLKYTSEGQKLFRPGSIANIIFVSDTHDPGSGYYGKPNAPASIPTTTEILSAINANQPELAGVVFSGVVPLPMASDPKLSGVNVLGNLPQTPEEESVSDEGTHGYSYLDFIRNSGGYAMHVVNDNWTNIIQNLTLKLGYLVNPQIKLNAPIAELKEILVGDLLLSTSDYKILDDHQTIIIYPKDTWPATLDITVHFVPGGN